MSGVHVVADGNPRQGGMDEDERDQCIHDVVSCLLKKQSGGIWFDEYKSLAAEDIADAAETLSGIKGWKKSFIPFAYLEEYRNRLLSGQFDFVDDVGLVERSRK
ncbi:hypothetical protein PybrP1_003921 [[Pythium] brassicae (nom. inval.)]|nr:hypothetical protein PybrP1_003921 [[Pythium] brassicae (nom. inval.)]